MLLSGEMKELLLHHPGLTAAETSTNEICLEGIVNIQRKWYCLKISCPHFPALAEMELKLQQHHRVISFTTASAVIQPQWTISELIENLPEIAAETTPITQSALSEDMPPSVALSDIYLEIAALHAPQAYTIELNETCTRIRFSRFEEHEEHYLDLELQPVLRVTSHSLPDGNVAWDELLKKCASLTAIVAQFQSYLDELGPFYANFVDIDELCHVLQPYPPTSKHNYRLFLLSERVFLKLVIADPFAPVSSMAVHIIGPTYEVEKLRHTYSEGLRGWDSELDIHKNLLRIFDLCYFPMPPNSEAAANDAENMPYCNICYGYQLEEGEIPIVTCDNSHCSLIFHAACLKEWFNTLSDEKTFLNVSFGACPFCKAKLSTSFAELLE